MHTLHTRTAHIFRWWAEENGETDFTSLWTQGWCPLLQGIARLCCDSRRQVWYWWGSEVTSGFSLTNLGLLKQEAGKLNRHTKMRQFVVPYVKWVIIVVLFIWYSWIIVIQWLIFPPHIWRGLCFNSGPCWWLSWWRLCMVFLNPTREIYT